MSIEKSSKKAGAGCMILFFSIFLLSGIASLTKGIITYLNEPIFTEDVKGLVIVGSVFILIGGGLILLVLVGKKKQSEQDALKEKFPDTPWLWQLDWREGRIKSSTPITMFVFWLFGIALGSAGMLIVFKLDEITSKGPIGYVVLLFPLVGIGMIIAAIRETLRWFKYGRVYCDLVTKPGVIGGWFQSIIWAKISMAPGETVNATLTCFHIYTSGSGDNRTTHRNVKWQEDILIPQERMMVQADGTLAIPVKVYIPRDCTPTTPGSPSNRNEWTLSAKADVAGIDFSADFTVPVFITDESRATPPENLEEQEMGTSPQPYTPTILVTESINGVELYAPPRRSPMMLLNITVFSILWTAIVAGMIFIDSDIPLIFPLIFGFFDVIILWGALWMWFGKSRISVEHDTVYISKTVFGIGPKTTLTTSDITNVDMHINMQSGNTPYYTIRIQVAGRHKNTVGGIRNKDEVEDLIKQLKKAIHG